MCAVAEFIEGFAKVDAATALAHTARCLGMKHCLLAEGSAPPGAKAAAPKTLLPHLYDE